MTLELLLMGNVISVWRLLSLFNDSPPSTYFANPVDEFVLFKDVHGVRFPKTASPPDFDAARRHLQKSLFQHGDTIAQVAPEGNVSLSWPFFPWCCCLHVLKGVKSWPGHCAALW